MRFAFRELASQSVLLPITMSRATLIALLLGLLLVAAPIVRAEDESYDDDEEEADAVRFFIALPTTTSYCL